MKTAIHPKYTLATITCACGAIYKVRSTKKEQRLEICAACHPFYTGKQKLIDTAGRVERFRQRYSKRDGATAEPVAPVESPETVEAAQS